MHIPLITSIWYITHVPMSRDFYTFFIDFLHKNLRNYWTIFILLLCNVYNKMNMCINLVYIHSFYIHFCTWFYVIFSSFYIIFIWWITHLLPEAQGRRSTAGGSAPRPALAGTRLRQLVKFFTALVRQTGRHRPGPYRRAPAKNSPERRAPINLAYGYLKHGDKIKTPEGVIIWFDWA